MPKYNITSLLPLDAVYQSGLLPQRNNKKYFYQDSSSRSNLTTASLSSENRRILKKTQKFKYKIEPLNKFNFDTQVLKTCLKWSKQLDWKFPGSSIKTIFTEHLFNYVYVWTENNQIIAYSICLFEKAFSHIAYVFYDPFYTKTDLPIRLSLQVIIDSIDRNLLFCYLGRFDPILKTGFYKRNFPNFEIYDYKNKTWQNFKKL